MYAISSKTIYEQNFTSILSLYLTNIVYLNFEIKKAVNLMNNNSLYGLLLTVLIFDPYV